MPSASPAVKSPSPEIPLIAPLFRPRGREQHQRGRRRPDLRGPESELAYDTAEIGHEERRPVLRRESATAVRIGQSSGPDARRGLRLQKLPAMAAA